MAIGKLETEQQLLDFIREELMGTLPSRLEQVIGMFAGGRAITSGHVTGLGWGGTGLLTMTVAHGMKVTPVFSVAVLREGGSIFFNVHYTGCDLIDATNVRHRWTLDTGTSVGTSEADWLAIGPPGSAAL